jgi:hypothetical protein
MIVIAHRINSIKSLKYVPSNYGVEIDIRSYKNQLVIHHDPFLRGTLLKEWLVYYKHKILILNVKEEGLEDKLIELMDRFNINNFFFLDQSFPFLVKYSKLGESRCATRVSEFESIDTALSLSGKVEWVWVDCFTRFPLNLEAFIKLKNAGFKICLVSPELQGRGSESEILSLQKSLSDLKIYPDAVCTKKVELWGV